MSAPRAILLDVGGVCLTNGWDHGSRRRAAERFSLDYDELERRHDALYAEFERGELGLDAYLDHAVFWRDRPFSRDDFTEFMRAQSRPHEDVLALVGRLRDRGGARLATLNNESRELNEFRIRRFGLDRLFEAFFSSCYLGVRKPSERIYRVALDVLGLDPDQVVFVDDRKENLVAARMVGLRTVLADGAPSVARGLREAGVEVEGPAAEDAAARDAESATQRGDRR